MGTSPIRRYAAVIPVTGQQVRFTADPTQATAELKVDGRTVRFTLTDTPLVGGYFMAEPTPDNYL